MTYSPIIPIGQQSPANQVNQVRTNFAQFATIFSSSSGGVNYNHTALNNFNQGDHETLLLQNQTVDPGVTQNLAVLYARNAVSAVGTQPQLFVQIPQFLPNNIPNAPMQLTYNQVNTVGPQYQSFLAGGFLFFFGNTTNIAIPITLTPTPSDIQMAIAQANTMTTVGTPIPYDAEVIVVQPNVIKISSNVFNTAGGTPTFSWMVIGRV